MAGWPGEQVAEAVHERPRRWGRDRSPRLALLEHAVEGVERLAHPGQLLGVGGAHGLGHALEVGVGDLLAQLLDELLEPFPSLRRDELVVLELPHPPGQVPREKVQGDPLLGRHVLGDLTPSLVARARASSSRASIDARSSASTSSSASAT